MSDKITEEEINSYYNEIKNAPKNVDIATPSDEELNNYAKSLQSGVVSHPAVKDANWKEALLPKYMRDVEEGGHSTLGKIGDIARDVGSGLLGGRLLTGAMRKVAGWQTGEPSELANQASLNTEAGRTRPTGLAGIAQDIAQAPFSFVPGLGAIGNIAKADKYASLAKLIAQGVKGGLVYSVPNGVTQLASDVGNPNVSNTQTAYNAGLNTLGGALIGGALPIAGKGVMALGSKSKDLTIDVLGKLGIMEPEKFATYKLGKIMEDLPINLENARTHSLEVKLPRGQNNLPANLKFTQNIEDGIVETANTIHEINKTAVTPLPIGNTGNAKYELYKASQPVKDYLWKKQQIILDGISQSGAKISSKMPLEYLESIMGKMDESGNIIVPPPKSATDAYKNAASSYYRDIRNLDGATPSELSKLLASYNLVLKDAKYSTTKDTPRIEVLSNITSLLKDELGKVADNYKAYDLMDLRQRYGRIDEMQQAVAKAVKPDIEAGESTLSDKLKGGIELMTHHRGTAARKLSDYFFDSNKPLQKAMDNLHEINTLKDIIENAKVSGTTPPWNAPDAQGLLAAPDAQGLLNAPDAQGLLIPYKPKNP